MSLDKLSEQKQEIVNNIIENLESTGKFTPEWDCDVFRPRNPFSGAVYQGANRLTLAYQAGSKGYDDPRWLTFKQAQTAGYKVKKGEKGTYCIKWIALQERAEKTKEEKRLEEEMKEKGFQTVERIRMIPKSFVVFNVAQIENFPKLEKEKFTLDKEFEIAEAFIKSSPCKISELMQDSAYYSPKNDIIILPPRNIFKDQVSFYSTALHEMTHSTGHKSRLNRDLTGSFGTESYAKEELVAELGCMFLKSSLNLSLDGKHFENHSAYINSWIKLLKKDPNEIFKSADLASKASNFLIDHFVEKHKNLASQLNLTIKEQIQLQHKQNKDKEL